MPLELTCDSCSHHGPSMSGYGECRKAPPPHGKLAGAGLVLVYGLTADDLPACGEYKPRAKDAPPALETKSRRPAR